MQNARYALYPAFVEGVTVEAFHETILVAAVIKRIVHGSDL